MSFISDLRFIEREDPVSGKTCRILQYKRSHPQVDASGAFCGLEEDPTWYDVPLEFSSRSALLKDLVNDP